MAGLRAARRMARAIRPHLLNVVACKMGATDDRLAEFHEFAKTRETAWQAQHGGPAFTEQSFLPRMLYGDYVTSLLRAASDREHVTLETAQDEVTDILSVRRRLSPDAGRRNAAARRPRRAGAG